MSKWILFVGFSFWMLLLILAVRDKAAYIEKVDISLFRAFRIEIISAEKKKSSPNSEDQTLN